jgi:hypothetical protein
MSTALDEIMHRASAEVEKWPEWRRSPDVKAEEREIRMSDGMTDSRRLERAESALIRAAKAL